jgi:hypothetical protein
MVARFVVLLFTLLFSLAVSASKQVTVLGLGAIVDSNVSDARQQAIEDAKRVAVEQMFGSYISARTETRNFMLASEKIYSTTKGRIDRFDIIEESKFDESTYQVKLTAFIDDHSILPSVDEQLNKYNWLKKPRILLNPAAVNLMSGNANSQVLGSAFNSVLGKHLRQAGFTVLNSQSVGKINATFSLDIGLDVLIQKSDYQGLNILSNELIANAQLTAPQVGIVVSSASAAAKKAGSDSLATLRKLSETLAQRITQRIVLDTKSAWVIDNSQAVMLSIKGSPEQSNVIIEALQQSVVGISGISTESREQASTSLLVQYKGWSEQLFDQLQLLSQQPTIPFSIESVQGATISLTTK